MEQDDTSQPPTDHPTSGASPADAAAQPPAAPKPKTKTISTELKVEERLPVVFDVEKYAGIEVFYSLHLHDMLHFMFGLFCV